jgi:hypothetical protein
MLLRALPQVRHCLDRAIDCRHRAKEAARAQTPEQKTFWTDMERKWIALAHSYDYQPPQMDESPARAGLTSRLR